MFADAVSSFHVGVGSIVYFRFHIVCLLHKVHNREVTSNQMFHHYDCLDLVSLSMRGKEAEVLVGLFTYQLLKFTCHVL
jgi:hypothetical protein